MTALPVRYTKYYFHEASTESHRPVKLKDSAAEIEYEAGKLKLQIRSLRA